MSDVVVVCLTVLLGLAGLAGAGVYLALTRWRMQRELAQREISRTETLLTGLQDLHDRLTAATKQQEDRARDIGERFEREHAQTSNAVLALCERVALFESALKNAISQVVEVTGYTEAKHKELKAKIVREPGMRPR